MRSPEENEAEQNKTKSKKERREEGERGKEEREDRKEGEEGREEEGRKEEKQAGRQVTVFLERIPHPCSRFCDSSTILLCLDDSLSTDVKRN